MIFPGRWPVDVFRPSNSNKTFETYFFRINFEVSKSDQTSYSFQIFVEDEMHVWVVTLVPSLKRVREEGRAEQQVVHKVVSEFVQTSGKFEEIYQPMEVIVRYNDVFRISGHVDHLLVQLNP